MVRSILMRISEWVTNLPSQPLIAGPNVLESTHQFWSGCAEEARAFLVARDWHRQPRKMLIVAPSYERCLKWQAKLELCGVPHSLIHQLPDGLFGLFEDGAPEHIALSDRLGALRGLVDNQPGIILATPVAALEKTLPRPVLEDILLEVSPGDQLDPSDVIRRLQRLGYENSDPVRIPGQFARRGGIVDVFVGGYDSPARIEFFGDEVDSIRTFDPNTQRSTGKLPAIAISPGRETLLPEEPDAMIEVLQLSLQVESDALNEEEAMRLKEAIQSDIRNLASKVFFDRIDLYRPILHPDACSAVELLDEHDVLVLDDPLDISRSAERSYDELADVLESRAKRGEILHTYASDFLPSPDHYASHSTILGLGSEVEKPNWLLVEHEEEVGAQSLVGDRSKPTWLADAIGKTLKSGGTVVVGTDQSSRAKAALNRAELFPEERIPDAPGLYLLAGNLGGGFMLKDSQLLVATDPELFGVGRLRLPQRRFLEGAPIATVLDIKPGDYVVHIQFGIGVFRGLVKKSIEGVEREFLYLEYAPPDKLFVPADQLDRVQKYLSPGDATPTINRLTGSEWQKTLSKAKEDAKAFAHDLVKLYAERSTVNRRPFGSDTPWQSEMESTFPWVETPSQLQAIRDVKNDLQLAHPMDRLVCGDVGFGKTEVAIRAAFKVVQENRQVAVLCPTTILSEQHARNFTERLESFGVQVALLNRFRSATERAQTLEQLQKGDVDILIGTHALLSNEIVFKELGLVVIDEEQKFGVKQKEALKKLRTELDVLSMSATPIPRTLSMALMDIRQMSLINDPPPGRLPVRSFVRPYAKEVVRDAIQRELARGGQVFYVYNRVQGIHHVAQIIQKLVPHARIGVGHGQMSESEIEPVMIGFVRGEIDVLISTSIIENGIDISNANTLIVENADRFGLSQLYQLKGRVGRSDRQAYSYFLYQSHKELSENAMHRLQALQEFGSLGAGYSLAFRDLQIRGAGDLLGSKQSGTMAAVGYELYTQLINEQVALLKAVVDKPLSTVSGETRAAKHSISLPTFEINVDAHIPPSYIADSAHRLYYYQQLMKIRTVSDLGEVRSEIVDRFGALPEEARTVFHVIHLRIRALELGIEKVGAAGGRIAAQILNRGQISPMAISLLTRANRTAYFSRDQLIWPYEGPVLDAADHMIQSIESSVEEAEAMRA